MNYVYESDNILASAISELQDKIGTLADILKDFIEDVEGYNECDFIYDKTRDKLDKLHLWDFSINVK